MFRDTLQGLKEWYARFKGRKFYAKVRKIYTRSNEIKLSSSKQQHIHDSFRRENNG